MKNINDSGISVVNVSMYLVLVFQFLYVLEFFNNKKLEKLQQW